MAAPTPSASRGGRRADGSYLGFASAPRAPGAVTPVPVSLNAIPGGRHSPPTRTFTTVPRCPPAGKMCVLVGSRDATACPHADTGSTTTASTERVRTTANSGLRASLLDALVEVLERLGNQFRRRRVFRS